jgi:hypothetical protein
VTDERHTRNPGLVGAGLAIGMGVGVALGNIAIGVASGIVFGIALSRGKRSRAQP